MNIVPIDPDKRCLLIPLFANYPPQRIFIHSVLEGHSGIALANSKTDPQVAQLTHPGWAILGGDVTHPIAQKAELQTSKSEKRIRLHLLHLDLSPTHSEETSLVVPVKD